MNTLPTEQELYDLYHVQRQSVKKLCGLLGLKYHYQFYQVLVKLGIERKKQYSCDVDSLVAKIKSN